MPFKASTEQAGFAIQPKLDCPHLKDEQVKELIEFLLHKNAQHFSEFQCNQCKDTAQNWICLNCQLLGCSRYVKGHMAEHNSTTKHPIALSFSDGSFWCYDCESYIDAPELRQARIQLSNSKFASETSQFKSEEEAVLKELQQLTVKTEEESKTFKYEDLVKGLKNKKYKNVVVLTGAGLSVASGIPDFRSPKTGLYSQLAKYNLPYPEAVFELGFFVKNPEPFLQVAKEYLSGEYEPTLGHKFIKKLEDEGVLSKNLTQNIDDLQTKAGISASKLIQAHGHSRTAHCIKTHSCGKQASIEKWKQHLQKLEVMKCESCKGLVKPDIVFFGEQLPKEFFEGPEIVEKADLVFVIGTSLAVAPFSYLGTMIKDTCPVVLINNQDSMPYRKDKLWLSGDIQQDIEKLMKDLEWI